MIEVCLQRATVQIPGQQANMNQDEDTEVVTFILSFKHTDNDNREHQVRHPTLGNISWTKWAFISICYIHYCKLH